MQKTEFSKNNTLALKGIAIIMMMFHHCFCTVSRFKNYDVSFFPFTQNFIVDISAMFKICVSIFAFITGYGLILSLKKINEKYEWTNKEISKWTIGRLIKTLSGYWIIVVLSLIICQLIDGRTASVLFNKGIIYGVIQTIINFLGLGNLLGVSEFCGTWWYMSIAILFIISVPILAKLLEKYGYSKVIIAIILIPRIIGWEYVNSSYIAFLFPMLLGIIFAENDLMVRIANIKIHNKIHVNKVIKFVIYTLIIIGLYFIYNSLPAKLFYEVRYGIIPVCIMCYLYEFFIDLPIVKQILGFLGKHSMNIFLTHTFFRVYYLNEFIYSQGNFIKIATVLLVLSLIISIMLELFKKLIRYDKIIDEIQNFVDEKIDSIYNKEVLDKGEIYNAKN